MRTASYVYPCMLCGVCLCVRFVCTRCLLDSGVVPTTAGGEVIAAAIASNGKDERYLLFQKHFPLKWAGWPFGTIGAQLFYWWLQARDEFQLMRQKYGV